MCIGSLQQQAVVDFPQGFYSKVSFPAVLLLLLLLFCFVFSSGFYPTLLMYQCMGTMGNKGGFSAVHRLSPISQGGKVLIIGSERPCVG